MEKSLTGYDDGSEDRGNWADMSRLHRKVGWQPKYSIDDGLNDTIEKFENSIDEGLK